MAWYRNRSAASKGEDKHQYITYWPHSISRIKVETNPFEKGFVRVISIDPGTINYAIRIEDRHLDGWITPVYFNVWQLKSRGAQSSNDPITHYSVLTRKLMEIKELWKEADIVIVERQLAINYKATRVMQHTISFFEINMMDLPHYPVIYDIMPQMKGKMLGAPPRISKKELKDWAVIRARELLEMRRDDWSLEVMNRSSKKDDLADTICQAEAMFILWGIDPITKPLPKASGSSSNKKVIIVTPGGTGGTSGGTEPSAGAEKEKVKSREITPKIRPKIVVSKTRERAIIIKQ